MRFSRERLIFKALCALDEVVERSRKAPVEPDFNLRFTLAYLHSVRIMDDDSSYSSFLATIQGSGQTSRSGPNMRGSYACTYFQGICRSVGIEYNVAFMFAMRDAREAKRKVKLKIY